MIPWTGTVCEYRGCPDFNREHEHTVKATPHPAEEPVLDRLATLTTVHGPWKAAAIVFGGTRA